MSKNNIDLVSLLNWAMDQKKMPTASPPKQRGYRQYRDPESEYDKLFKTFLADQLRNRFKEMDEKLNKKEEKKPEKTWWEKMNFLQKIAILTVTVPPCMMSMILLVVLFVKALKAIG